MSTSQVLRVPDLSKLQLSEKQRTLFVRDDQIFREMLLLHRENVDRQGGARNGDYVSVTLFSTYGAPKRVQIELGGKAYQDLQEALRGGEPGQKLDVSLDGQEVHIQIHTVRQVIEFALKDEAVAACKNRHPSPICTRFEHHFHVLMNIPPQTGQQNGGNRSRVTVEMSPGVRMQVQAVE